MSMQKESINLLAQLMSAIKEILPKLEEAYKKKDIEKMTMLKREILDFQARIDQLL